MAYYSKRNYAFSTDLKDTYLYITIIKHHHGFLQFVRQHKPYQWKVLPFGIAMAPRVFTMLTKPMLFLCHCDGLHVIIYLDDILVLTCSKCAGKTTQTFLCSLFFVLVYISIFQV